MTMVRLMPLVLAVLLAGCAQAAAALPLVGPRGAVGPDVPLSAAESNRLASRITVTGRTAAAVQEACDRAAANQIATVFLPAGEYVFDKTVTVPKGLTLLGAGSRTVVRTANRDTHLFEAGGDHVRFTRLRLVGADTSQSDTNDTYGIAASAVRNVRVDHCELLGFSYATTFTGKATAQLDHCRIHDNRRSGLGYGVALYSGAYVLITDSEFSQCRHCLASNGTLDWSSPERLGRYVHKPGRKTHWEFVHNRVGSNDGCEYELPTVDTHPGMDGSFVVESNLFENLRQGLGLRDGSGLIRGNVFRNLRTIANSRPRVAISIAADSHNGIPVEGCMPHDIVIRDNVFSGTGPMAFAEGIVFDDPPTEHAIRYMLGAAESITIEGKLVPQTQKQRAAPEALLRLREMGEDGVLRWGRARPR
jgi:hypothetical protein